MTSVEKLEKIRDRIEAWSAYKALREEAEDSQKLDKLARALDKVIKEMK